MRIYNRISVLLATLLLVCSSCHHAEQVLPTPCDEPRYLTIEERGDYRVVTVLSPWQNGDTLSRLYLVGSDSVLTPADAPRIHVPIRRLATTSATQIGYLHALGASDCVCAIATPHLVYNSPTDAAIVDLGEDFSLNVEALLLSRPELVLMTSYGAPLTNIEHIRKAGIPVLEVVEWVEEAPLARAAWLRLYGALTGKEAEADSILIEVSDTYHRTADDIASRDVAVASRSVATGQSYRGTWYVPSASTYMGRLLADAGAQYAFATDTTHGSIPLTLEQALTTFAEADVWIGVNATSLDELERIDSKHTWMRAFRTKHVYNFCRRTSPTGANDFWETGTVHPEYILQDIIWALDSTALSSYTPHYIQQLQ